MEELDYGNCEVVTLRGKEAYVNDMGLRTGTGYKAAEAGKLAPHSEAHSSAAEVKPEVVYPNNMSLPGEASLSCVDRFQSTAEIAASMPAMGWVTLSEESAESIVVVAPEPVSSCRRWSRPAKSAASRIR